MIRRLPVVKGFMLRRCLRCLKEASDPDSLDRALCDVTRLLAQDPALKTVLTQFDAGADDIRALYHFIMLGGALRWLHGRDIAARSIANPIILFAYLRDRHRAAERDFHLGFVDTCVRYHDGGYTDGFLFGMLSVPRSFRPLLQ